MQGFGLVNTGLPLAALSALALLLPLVTVPRATRSQARLAGGIALAAMATYALGAALFAALYALEGSAPRVGAVLRASALAALAWAPLLALAWVVRAQGVERRRGTDMARAGRVDAARRGRQNDGQGG